MLLRVWWIPQVPGSVFHVAASSVQEGVKIMDVLALNDLFQYENNIKPDYSNAGGLQMFDAEDKTDSPEGSWTDWFIELGNDYFDDPEEYLEWLND